VLKDYEDKANEIRARSKELDVRFKPVTENYHATLEQARSDIERMDSRLEGQHQAIERTCFPAETPIAVKSSFDLEFHSVPISSVHVGDSVISCNLEIEGGTCHRAKVIAVMEKTVDHLIRLTAGDVVIDSTDNHPFYVANKKAFLPAIELNKGDLFQKITGETVALEKAEYLPGQVTVYDLEVEHDHNYYAHGVLVHNCNQIRTQMDAGELKVDLGAMAKLVDKGYMTQAAFNQFVEAQVPPPVRQEGNDLLLGAAVVGVKTLEALSAIELAEANVAVIGATELLNPVGLALGAL
jgi:hypothetical protein